MKKYISIVLAALCLVALLVSCGGSKSKTTETSAEKAAETTAAAATTAEASASSTDSTIQQEELDKALESAKAYNSLAMSRQFIIDTLTDKNIHGYSNEAAAYAVDNLNADWNENALTSAKVYKENSAESLSDEEIKDRLLTVSKFTASEIEYAMSHLND